MSDRPSTLSIALPGGIPSEYNNHFERRLSSMADQYADSASCAGLLASGDVVLYEVYELTRPSRSGELSYGTSILHPGKVGDEYFMTKGHFHARLGTAEVYYCLQGTGMIVMENPESEWSVEELAAGQVLYVPPRWAHRSVNTSTSVDLVTFFIYPAYAGHDYGTIETSGFRKLVVECCGHPAVIDNPRWRRGALE